jgi:hypothetical protein
MGRTWSRMRDGRRETLLRHTRLHSPSSPFPPPSRAAQHHPAGHGGARGRGPARGGVVRPAAQLPAAAQLRHRGRTQPLRQAAGACLRVYVWLQVRGCACVYACVRVCVCGSEEERSPHQVFTPAACQLPPTRPASPSSPFPPPPLPPSPLPSPKVTLTLPSSDPLYGAKRAAAHEAGLATQASFDVSAARPLHPQLLPFMRLALATTPEQVRGREGRRGLEGGDERLASVARLDCSLLDCGLQAGWDGASLLCLRSSPSPHLLPPPPFLLPGGGRVAGGERASARRLPRPGGGRQGLGTRGACARGGHAVPGEVQPGPLPHAPQEAALAALAEHISSRLAAYAHPLWRDLEVGGGREGGGGGGGGRRARAAGCAAACPQGCTVGQEAGAPPTPTHPATHPQPTPPHQIIADPASTPRQKVAARLTKVGRCVCMAVAVCVCVCPYTRPPRPPPPQVEKSILGASAEALAVRGAPSSPQALAAAAARLAGQGIRLGSPFEGGHCG